MTWKAYKDHYKTISNDQQLSYRTKFTRFQRVIVLCLFYLFCMATASILNLWIFHAFAIVIAGVALWQIFGGIREITG